MAKKLGQRESAVKDIGSSRLAKPLALPRLVSAVGLIDDVKPSAPAHHAVVAMALTQGPERILDLHAKHLKQR